MRLGLLTVYVREVARAAELADIGGAARRLALEIARELLSHDVVAIELTATRAGFGSVLASDHAALARLASALNELVGANLLGLHYSAEARNALQLGAITVLVPMRRRRVFEVIDVRLVARDEHPDWLLEDEEWEGTAASVRSRIAGRRGRVVELPEEVIGA